MAITSGPRNVHAFALNQKTGKIAYLANDFEHLDDVYVRDEPKAPRARSSPISTPRSGANSISRKSSESPTKPPTVGRSTDSS